MLGPPFIFLSSLAELKREQLFSQADRSGVHVLPGLCFRKERAFWSAKNFPATDSPKIVLVEVYLQRVITAWGCVLMHKVFDNVLLEPYKDYGCQRVNSRQLNEITYMRVCICVTDREEEFVVYTLVIWILFLAAWLGPSTVLRCLSFPYV